MKKPTKIIVAVVVVVGTIGTMGGLFVKSKIDDAKAIVNEAKNQSAKVKRGDIKVTVAGSGVVALKDKTNPDYDELELEVEIDELDIDKVAVNQSVEIKLDAFPDEVFYGIVTDVSPQGTVVNGVSNFMIKVSLPTDVKEIAKVNKDTQIRQGKSNDYISVANLEKDDEVELIKEDGDYYKVATKDSVQGYIEKDDLTDIKIKPNQSGIINKDVVNLKEDSSSNSDTVIKLIDGDSVEILDKEDDWYKVKTSNNQEGYIETSDLNTVKIKPGMNASASILVEQKDDVLYVPIEAVNKENIDDYYVVVPKNSKEQDVNVGIHNEDYIEVTKGLNEGEEVKLPEKEISLPQSPFDMMPHNNSK
ncbi:SH3 domain-containing protein [Paraclostridium bifermentans]|uniref:SH3 domain-containing protein n=1 Tax=Paraclostridium bifermentans TaxID=1490 RepID=UPI00359C0FFC